MLKRAIVLRFNYFQDYDFVNEHNRISEKNGHVWLLKIGRKIPENKMKSILSDNGCLILKADKKHGGLFYETKLLDFYSGKPTATMQYPEYYCEMIDSLSYTRNVSVDGTWLMISSIAPMSEAKIARLVLDKNNELVRELLEKCSSSFVYAHFKEVNSDGENEM